MNTKVIDGLLSFPTHQALISFQSFIRNNSLKSQEIRALQRAFTSSLKEKEKENCDLILEAMQVFIQKYHEQLIEWLYILIVKLIQRQSSASAESHIRALHETTDLIKNLFPQRLLLQLSCKFVMDSVQVINSSIKFQLLQFIRVLVISSKPIILENTFPDLIMAVSRIISWTADIKSLKVRKESERVVQKLFNLNPVKFALILKSLPIGFQQRAKIILKINTVPENTVEMPKIKQEPIFVDPIACQESQKNVESINLGKRESPYPKPGLLNKSHATYVQYHVNSNEDTITKGIMHSSIDSIPKTLLGNSATVTYSDSHQISHTLKKLRQKNKLLEISEPNTIENYTSRKKEKKHRTHKSRKSKDWKDMDEIKELSEIIKKSKKSKRAKDVLKTDVIDLTDVDTILKDISTKLSRFNERHQERKLSLLSLIECINSIGKKCWDSHFKTIMSLLLETLGDNESGTRKLALVSIQELAKVEPERFQDQIMVIVEKLLQCFLDSDQGVIQAVKSCAYTFSYYLNVDTLWRTLNSIIVDNEKIIQSVGLRFMSYVIRASTPVIVSCLLIETLSLLHKFTRDKNIELRKNSIFCLITLYTKIGDKIWPNLKNFEKSTVKLLQIYIRRL